MVEPDHARRTDCAALAVPGTGFGDRPSPLLIPPSDTIRSAGGAGHRDAAA